MTTPEQFPTCPICGVNLGTPEVPPLECDECGAFVPEVSMR